MIPKLRRSVLLVGATWLFVVPMSLMAQPYLVADIDTTGDPWYYPCNITCPPPDPIYGSRPHQLTPLGDSLLFMADDHVRGTEVWITDGNPGNAQLVRDAVPGPGTPLENHEILGVVGDRAIVWTGEATTQRLWATDESGSVLEVDFACPGCSYLRPVGHLEGAFLFQGYDGVRQSNVLFGTDGFRTWELLDLCQTSPTCFSERISTALSWSSSFYFEVSKFGDALRHYRLDAPEATPEEIAVNCLWRDQVAVGDELLAATQCFDPDTNLFQKGLYSATNPETEPVLIRALSPNAEAVGPTRAFGDAHAAFVVDTEVWITDGTTDGTHAAAPFDALEASSVVGLGPHALFSGVQGGNRGLWAVDESGHVVHLAAGSPLPLDVLPLPKGSPLAFFAMHDTAHGAEPWSTDGTPEGTSRVGDIQPGPGSSYPDPSTSPVDVPPGTGFHMAGSRVYFGADDGSRGHELWAIEVDVDEGPPGPPEDCPDPTVLCLYEGRFQVEALHRDYHFELPGTPFPMTSDTGAFWFFDGANVEVVVKIVDGRSLNDHFWVFYASLSNVEFDLTVTDTETGETWTHTNAMGTFASGADIMALPDAGTPN